MQKHTAAKKTKRSALEVDRSALKPGEKELLQEIKKKVESRTGVRISKTL